ncbi:MULTISPECIES: YHS domain-containing (seleno)protein [unclassified Mameliella]|uniref:YHS domain-containing (seleno)protein n=1 Tax=unclassified Mameliella TaxID=2630630 RepID=UPI00273E58C1|nr:MULTISPECIES: YHS domain-containing (seleno)protein [unclassified Mameliella]
MTKLTFAAAVSASLIALASAAFAADEYNVSNGLTLTGHPLGMHGFDPVSMFKADAPKIGDAEFTSEHDGVDYYFANAESKAAFDADPAAMLPQFGGFCAFGVYAGKKLDGDVRYADIVDGKLYLFVNKAIFDKYLEDRDTVISGAFAKWPEIMETPIDEL